jgi:peptidoglycan DL-endopeptidase CwlO
VLSATRRRVLPASLLASGALTVGLLGAAIPAQATTVTRAATVKAAPAAVTARTLSATRASATPARLAAYRAAARVAHVRALAVAIAHDKLGDRYSAGSSGPRRFDCSGLALYVVRYSSGRSLPHYSKAQFAATKRVSKGKLRPGDLVFFFRHGAHHVGIYIGKGRMISATNPRSGVKIDAVFSGWYGSRYSGAGRLV